MKILAMYLPQFHRVKENDEWWGEGFTEWVAVKNATALFDGHEQPRVPLFDNYYNLLDKKTMLWQAELMSRYGVDGLVFYHYYFKDGRRILEKPAENLLGWKDIDMPFCFSWANETWARSWSNISDKNVWADDGKNIKSRARDDGILLKQAYGQEKDWLDHFYYLEPFFEDKRYIKIDGKPLLIIYRTESIGCLVDMIDLWRNEAIKCGLEGLYIVSTNKHSDACDGELFQEPQYSTMMYYQEKYKDEGDGIERKIDYNEISKKSADLHSRLADSNQFSSVFPAYDDTPRRGRSGTAIINSSPEVFQNYLETIIRYSIDRGNDTVFINAWNEWGETMYLEPDEKHEYKYLEAIRNAKGAADRFVIPKESGSGKSHELMKHYEKKLEQYRSYWTILDKWLLLKEKDCSLVEYLRKMDWKDIAIYGIGMIGHHLISEVQDSSIHILYGIDGKGDAIKIGFPVYTIEDELPKADVIIVTVEHEYKTIREILKNKTECRIVSIASVIEGAMG